MDPDELKTDRHILTMDPDELKTDILTMDPDELKTDRQQSTGHESSLAQPNSI